MTHKQILDLGRRWADAEQQGDVTTLDTLLADDFVGIGPRGFVLDREQWLERYRSGDLKNDAMSWQDVTVRDYGEAAVAVGILTQQAAFRGHDASGRFRLAQVAIRQGGRWLIASMQLSGPIPDGAPGRA